jgi:phasin family protein
MTNPPAKTTKPRVPRPKPVIVHGDTVEAVAETVTAAVEPVVVELDTVAAAAHNPHLVEKVTKMAKTIHGFEELSAFGKANVDALVEANTIFVKGVEEISKEMFSLTKSSFEQAAAMTSAFLQVKTLKDLVELNADYSKLQYEKLLANSTKLGELTVKLATEASAPIAARANHLVETVVHPAA